MPLLFSLALAGCTPDPLDSLAVESAEFYYSSDSHGLAAVVGGYSTMDAGLVIQEVDGPLWEAPVELSGTLLGLGVDVGFGFVGVGTLSCPDEALVANDILGDYSGQLASFAGGIGFDELDVTNAAQCRISIVAISAGIGVAFGGALLNLHLLEDLAEVESEDTGGIY